MAVTLRNALIGLSVIAAPLLAACQPDTSARSAPPRTVRIAAVRPVHVDQTVTLTGTIAARTETATSFRTSGRIVERLVDVGDHVRKGQVLARLDTRTQAADVQSAQAGVVAADAQVRQTTAAFERSQSLFAQGFATRRDFDQANRAMKVAQANADSARAQLASAEETLSFAELKADADGIVTSRLLDVGETAQAASTMFSIAWDGPRDALFDIYEGLLLEGKAAEPVEIVVRLVADPAVMAKGAVRQVAPTVDAQTATVRVKIGLDEVPARMTLGAAVSGTGRIASPLVFVLPAAALTADAGKPAVWVLDPATRSVTPRAIVVRSYGADTVIADGGLSEGEKIVVDGTKLLRPGQTVAIAEETASR
ncbi:efflux RND transporter periplasmic adaptor subunit [Prosthecomicrobium hirschii]|uniref:efflux RND transporter periplasmic adaptor subunit n=1 Tax=Prosthecodimorpha hirschii TaxID=665126 RepID=UPI0009F9A85D|nr:efflux RND transporter periplasmic adaptor subunit [Prosthecomicrobium hirschii]